MQIQSTIPVFEQNSKSINENNQLFSERDQSNFQQQVSLKLSKIREQLANSQVLEHRNQQLLSNVSNQNSSQDQRQLPSKLRQSFDRKSSGSSRRSRASTDDTNELHSFEDYALSDEVQANIMRDADFLNLEQINNKNNNGEGSAPKLILIKDAHKNPKHQSPHSQCKSAQDTASEELRMKIEAEEELQSIWGGRRLACSGSGRNSVNHYQNRDSQYNNDYSSNKPQQLDGLSSRTIIRPRVRVLQQNERVVQSQISQDAKQSIAAASPIKQKEQPMIINRPSAPINIIQAPTSCTLVRPKVVLVRPSAVAASAPSIAVPERPSNPQGREQNLSISNYYPIVEAPAASYQDIAQQHANNFQQEVEQLQTQQLPYSADNSSSEENVSGCFSPYSSDFSPVTGLFNMPYPENLVCQPYSSDALPQTFLVPQTTTYYGDPYFEQQQNKQEYFIPHEAPQNNYYPFQQQQEYNLSQDYFNYYATAAYPMMYYED